MNNKYPSKQVYVFTIEYSEDGVPMVRVDAPGYVLKGKYLLWPHVQQAVINLASCLDGREDYPTVIIWEEAIPDESLIGVGADAQE